MTRLRSLLLALLALGLLAAPAADAKKVPLIRLVSGTTTIVPDPAFAAALQGLSVTPTVLIPGAATSAGFAFPIVSGTLAGKKPAAGQIRHFGGLRLSAPDGTHVDLNNLRINDGRKVVRVTAQVGSGPRIGLATLDDRGATITVTKHRFLFDGARLLLTDGAAQALDAQFATTAFTAGQVLGTATVDAKIKLKVRRLKG